MPYLFVLFVTVPIIEIALFIQVGGWIGLWPTVLIVVVTALAGTALLRQQGLAALDRLKASLQQMGDPSRPLADGAMILFAGALLLTPGFFTDVLGLSLMVPGIRGAIFHAIGSRVKMTMQTRSTVRPADAHPNVIDAEYEDLTDQPRTDRPPSGWTRH